MAVLRDKRTGREQILFERPRSKCLFYPDLKFQDYEITLRLDWTDLKNGDPVLDADIYKVSHGKRIKIKNGRWHHTVRKYNPLEDSAIYQFEFKGMQLILSSTVTYSLGIGLDAILEKRD